MDLDKFYTPLSAAKQCIDIVYAQPFEISDIIEPSAGSGSFSLQIPNCIAYDLEPEHESIIKQDFLKLDLPYKQGRLIIGNPPFGLSMNLARSFYKKSTRMCDYIAFILPISQLENKDSLFEFDLIESVDLGVLKYSGVSVHCCFNVYIRPLNGRLNKKPIVRSNTIKIYRDDQDGYKDIVADFCIFRRGSKAGTERFDNLHTQTYKIVVTDKQDIPFVRDKILNFDWLGFKKHQSAPSLSKNNIYRLFSN